MAHNVFMFIFLVIFCIPLRKAEDNFGESLSRIFIRQETALRKLDAIILKVSKVDALEVELESMRALLETQIERNQILEHKLEGVAVKLDDVSAEVKNNSVITSEIASSALKLQSNLEEVAYGRTEEYKEVITLLKNCTGPSQQIMNFTIALSSVCEGAVEDMKALAESVIVNTTSDQSKDKESIQLNTHIQDSLTNLSNQVTANTNMTKHLFAAAFNRIAVSNLAMDKRLGALLHTSSTRQRVLQESILTALSSVSAVVKTQTQDAIRKTESKLGTLELSLASSVKRHAKELATQVLEAANVTLNEVFSTTMSRLEDLYEASVNQSTLIEDNIRMMSDMKNFTSQQTVKHYDLCVVSLGEDDENRTLEYKQSTKQIEQIIRGQQRALHQQLSIITEQLSGLRIYYSTSLHMHTDQVVSAMNNIQDEVNEAVRETLTKSTRHLEKLRRSSLGYLDAAVTSISSAAVASAQSTAHQLEEAMKAMTAHVGERLDKLQSSVSLLVTVCPPKYTNVGGTCLLAFREALTSWETARHICHQEGGDLMLVPNNEMLNHLQVFLYNTHSGDTSIPPPYWVGARKQKSHWMWLNDCPVNLKISDLLWVEDENVSHEYREADKDCKCLMAWGAGVELIPSSCDSLRAVLCQYQSHYSNLTSEIQSDAVFDLIPETSDEPNVIVDDESFDDISDTGYDDIYSYT